MSKFFTRSRELYIRNFVFGVEDSIVSTVGLLSGIAVGGVPRETIVLTGLILVLVEACAMGIGSFISESSAQEFADRKGNIAKQSASGALVMFFSYCIAGSIPLFPYTVQSIENPFLPSIILSLVALFLFGAGSGRISRENGLLWGLRMMLLGGLAILIGVTVGELIPL